MNAKETGFLLLTSKLGDPNRRPLTTAQLRLLAQRYQLLPKDAETELTLSHLLSLGLEQALCVRILRLLKDELQLDAYLKNAKKQDCRPITRTSEIYPPVLRKRLGNDCPGCLWAKGDDALLSRKKIALVGSRDIVLANRRFAREVGRQAALQGYVLVSGNARGADLTAQTACLEAGGAVISVVADSLTEHHVSGSILYLSEEEYDEPFSAMRALHRNRIIHALGNITIVAQCTEEKGGTWDGSIRNLRSKWSPLFCYRDSSAGSFALERMGAILVDLNQLHDFSMLCDPQMSIF